MPHRFAKPLRYSELVLVLRQLRHFELSLVPALQLKDIILHVPFLNLLSQVGPHNRRQAQHLLRQCHHPLQLTLDGHARENISLVSMVARWPIRWILIMTCEFSQLIILSQANGLTSHSLPDDQLELDGGKAVRSPKPKLNLSKQTPSIRIRPNYSRSAVSLWQQGAPIRHPSASSTSTLVSYDLPPSNSSTLNSHSGVPQSASGKLPSSSSTSHLNVPHTPPKIRRTASAVVMLPTTTGEVIELDPLSTSPGTVDALEGLTASTKKMAKEEMVKFVTEAVARWNVQI